MSEAILDPSLLNAMNLVDREEMFLVQRIALLCTRKDPKLRPTMRDVADLLKSLSKKMDDKIENGDDELGESTSKRNEIGILSIQM
ncbi:hypothetical protein KC19_7G078000 [Ceratodon purpureus]|uniref:Uncharacterized protein n=1 Tax=Ceratodon purpureus TaxID=3225 RepID=A0A8T0H7E7_CERPU|nr:hypothetical protein KC19_7G078000 [Ceratodon purpureus]